MRRKLRQAAAGLIISDDVDVASDDDDGDDDDEQTKTTSAGKTSSERQATAASSSDDKDKEDSELRMQLDSAEHEVASYRCMLLFLHGTKTVCSSYRQDDWEYIWLLRYTEWPNKSENSQRCVYSKMHIALTAS